MSVLSATRLALDVPGKRLFTSLSFEVPQGTCLAVVGPSGSGKTSLLNCLAGIAAPAEGSVVVGDVDIWRLPRRARTAFRLRDIGMVFQFGELIPELTLVENVALPLRLAGVGRRAAEDRARIELDRLGLAAHVSKHPSDVSGGEMQRAAVARALVHRPRILLADEPTGSLDRRTADEVARVLLGSAREAGAAVVVATHDVNVARMADEVLDVGSLSASPPGSD